MSLEEVPKLILVSSQKKKCMRHMNRTKQHKNHSNLYILLLFLFNKDLLLVPYLILVASHRNYTLNIKSLPIMSLCELRLLTETCFRAHMYSTTILSFFSHQFVGRLWSFLVRIRSTIIRGRWSSSARIVSTGY